MKTKQTLWARVKGPLLGTLVGIPAYFALHFVWVVTGVMSPTSVVGGAVTMFVAGVFGSAVFDSKVPIYIWLGLALVGTGMILMECGPTLSYPCELVN